MATVSLLWPLLYLSFMDSTKVGRPLLKNSDDVIFSYVSKMRCPADCGVFGPEYCDGKLVFLKSKIEGYTIRKCIKCGVKWILKPRERKYNV